MAAHFPLEILMRDSQHAFNESGLCRCQFRLRRSTREKTWDFAFEPAPTRRTADVALPDLMPIGGVPQTNVIGTLRRSDNHLDRAIQEGLLKRLTVDLSTITHKTPPPGWGRPDFRCHRARIIQPLGDGSCSKTNDQQ
jgi:hypothetical protein